MLVFPYVHNLGTPGFQCAVVNLVPWKKLHNIRDMVDVMHHTSLNIFNKVKVVVTNENGPSKRIGKGKDIMSALVKANMSASEEDKLTDEELIGQASTIIFAAMDMTSNGMSRILYLLSKHPAVQDRLWQEVTEAYANHGGDLDYETLNSLPYLDAVCRELLRV
ncbi:cytochrome P450 [Coprinellus micaceus]|uniref:Cytochrome P450 n=1 Tax=Coprinellus micaceus TaxID=71717 RepID=A0A4Y7SXI9_COPMI|nr:cytochrome P450 [Coprinellus micaceus]